MCDCIKEIAKGNYVHPDMLHPDRYYLYPIVWNNGKGKVNKGALLVNYCPNCGERLF